jgi:hypothetical protein
MLDGKQVIVGCGQVNCLCRIISGNNGSRPFHAVDSESGKLIAEFTPKEAKKLREDKLPGVCLLKR